jgi:hypothetical protein
VGCPESTAYIDERLHVLWSQPIQEVGSERPVKCLRHARQLLSLEDLMDERTVTQPTVLVIGGGYGGIRVVHDRVVQFDGERALLGSGAQIGADFFVLSTGSRYPFPAKSDVHLTEHAFDKYRAAHAALVAARRVLIIGAGPVGLVYIAAFGLDEGESIGALLSQGPPTPALAHLVIDQQGFAWIPEDDFVHHFAADVDPVKAR